LNQSQVQRQQKLRKNITNFTITFKKARLAVQTKNAILKIEIVIPNKGCG